MKNSAPKRKIIKDRTFPSPGEIERHKDFARISQGYKASKLTLMKKSLLWGGAAVGAAVIAGVVIVSTAVPENLPKPDIAPNPISGKEACIQPPFPGNELPYSTYRISARQGGVIHYPSGSTITIPANAFANPNGGTLNDSVEIRYREFHNPLEIFLSGIPMGYDSAGLHRTLESAGMIEIRAYDQRQELSLRKQSSIDIKMATANTEERFNLYELDTVNHNWIYKGKDKIVSPEEQKPQQKNNLNSQQVKTSATTANPAEEIKPELSNPDKYTFNIDYNNQDFPELAAYKNVLFEVTDNSFKPSYYKINWSKISLVGSNEPGTYIIKLKKADTTISVMAKPVFEKDDYDQALAKFEQMHKVAEAKHQQQEKERQETINKVNGELAKYNNGGLFVGARTMAGLTGYRMFTITSLGYHNCDYPLPPIMQYAFNFYKIAEEKQNIGPSGDPQYNTIFLVEKGKNTVFRFNKGEPVRCNPGARNLMWTITEKNQIAFFRIEDYRKLQNGGKNYLAPVVAANQQTAFNEIKQFSGQGL